VTSALLVLTSYKARKVLNVVINLLELSYDGLEIQIVLLSIQNGIPACKF
jgi:hypothetical protein